MNTSEKNEIIQLFESHFNEKVERFELLPPSGSYREYCRLGSENRTVIGAFNTDVKENTAFLSFSNHFYNKGIKVPKVYSVSSDLKKYLLEDLGNTTLFEFLTKTREEEGFSENIVSVYKKVLQALPKIQIIAGKEIDYSVCYPREAFDKQSMMWDLNYFKYYFLKLAKIHFDEQALEDDFQLFSNYLLSASSNYFLYRDFQSRNVMLKDDEVHFIDYQGGRLGALQYDLASLLYDGKADIPESIRTQLYDYYISELKKYMKVDEEKFSAYFKGFVLIRIMQAMGAYGFRGFYEKKEHFLKSIPYALKNLEVLLADLNLPVDLPELKSVLNQLTHSEVLKEIGREKSNLTVRITSFSFKKGYPEDPSGNGGGHVFDCRAINNPGRYEEYKKLSGKDLAVQEFLEQKSEIGLFVDAVKVFVDQSVKVYLERGFTHLSLGFGCTGGQHRSVYSAEKISEYLQNNYPVNVVVVHREQENWR
ncbi:RNase adapter RapZ [Draconibacterium sp. IB214405]|uniref:RapZ C-terminal domain-containing protein n=1 Tax=Draconibacterium sp. IB214405 TaxID=3097352 RepID=UPI002A0F0419|nr:RNase adapter RapZ [Draconibacterium sp. IB214405]MDX8339912.1 RNase adapter RapZ [Draconibacterium sp. IB214405]